MWHSNERKFFYLIRKFFDFIRKFFYFLRKFFYLIRKLFYFAFIWILCILLWYYGIKEHLVVILGIPWYMINSPTFYLVKMEYGWNSTIFGLLKNDDEKLSRKNIFEILPCTLRNYKNIKKKKKRKEDFCKSYKFRNKNDYLCTWRDFKKNLCTVAFMANETLNKNFIHIPFSRGKQWLNSVLMVFNPMVANQNA